LASFTSIFCSQHNAPMSCEPGYDCRVLQSPARTAGSRPRDHRVSLSRLPHEEAGPCKRLLPYHQRLRERTGSRTKHRLNRPTRHVAAHRPSSPTRIWRPGAQLSNQSPGSKREAPFGCSLCLKDRTTLPQDAPSVAKRPGQTAVNLPSPGRTSSWRRSTSSLCH
jgi:hypothetical protein